MKSFICSFVLLTVLAVVCSEKYTTKYDGINIIDILKSDRLVESYVDCGIDVKPCKTPDSKELKKHMKDALLNSCADCSEKQKEVALIVCKHLVQKRADLWAKLVAFYDKDGTYQKQNANYLDKCRNDPITEY